MSYDIPDKIQYKEKIVFNLTFKQLIYASVFMLLAFFSLGLPLDGNAKLVLPFFFVIGGLGFVFLNMDRFLFDRASFYRNVRFGGALDKNVQGFAGIRKIENDVVYLNSGELRAVLTVYPVNYQNLDETRKKSVTLNYRDFLNQLSHPVQILARTVNVSLSEYFAHSDKKVDKMRNPQLKKLYNEFKEWEQDFVKKNQVKERLYYLVIPYEPDASLLTKPKSFVRSIKDYVRGFFGSEEKKFSESQDEFYRRELSDRLHIIQQKLVNGGLVSRRLSSNELISLFMSYFDGYVEVNEDYLSRVIVVKSFFAEKKTKQDKEEKDEKQEKENKKEKEKEKEKGEENSEKIKENKQEKL